MDRLCIQLLVYLAQQLKLKFLIPYLTYDYRFATMAQSTVAKIKISNNLKSDIALISDQVPDPEKIYIIIYYRVSGQEQRIICSKYECLYGPR